MRVAEVCPSCPVYTNAACVVYTGDYLSTIDVQPLDELDEILGKINNSINPNLIVYNEGTETVITSDNVTLELDSEDHVINKTVSLELGSFDNTNYIDFTFSSLKDRVNFGQMSYYIWLKSQFDVSTYFKWTFYKGVTAVTDTIDVIDSNYGFSRTTIGSFQSIVIPLNDFIWTDGQFDRIRLTFNGANVDGFWFDFFILEKILTATVPSFNFFKTILDNSGNIIEATQPNDTLQILGSSKVSDKVLQVGSNDVFASDVTFVLSSGKSFGKYTNGQTAPWTGLTAIEALLDAAVEYINPVFNSFSVSGQNSTVEVGTTLSGNRTFNWSITVNSGVVPTVTIFDITLNAPILVDTPNDTSELVNITTNQLNSSGATQQWRAIGNNTSPAGTFISTTTTVTARYYRFFGASASTPINNTQVRALTDFEFQTANANTFILNTGDTLTKFIVALPPSRTISSVVDLDALNAVITSEYILIGPVIVIDAGGTNRSYNLYEMNIGAPYSSNHRHQITTI
jgi:hypothetical protein